MAIPSLPQASETPQTNEARPTNSAERKAETRRRILAAARPVFLREGFISANLNEVAREAGVGKGTLYRHFENKGELYLAVLSENGEIFLEEMRGAIDFEVSALEQIEQIAKFYVDFWVRHPEYFKITWAVQNPELIGPISPELERRLADSFEKPVRLLEALIKNGVERGELRPCDPWNMANAIGICGGAAVGYIIGMSKSPLERDARAVWEQMLDLALAGLRPHPTDRQ